MSKKLQGLFELLGTAEKDRPQLPFLKISIQTFDATFYEIFATLTLLTVVLTSFTVPHVTQSIVKKRKSL